MYLEFRPQFSESRIWPNLNRFRLGLLNYNFSKRKKPPTQKSRILNPRIQPIQYNDSDHNLLTVYFQRNSLFEDYDWCSSSLENSIDHRLALRTRSDHLIRCIEFHNWDSYHNWPSFYNITSLFIQMAVTFGAEKYVKEIITWWSYFFGPKIIPHILMITC